jgi:hypothetical protein
MFRTQKKWFSVDSEFHLLKIHVLLWTLLDMQELTGAALEKVEAHTCR